MKTYISGYRIHCEKCGDQSAIWAIDVRDDEDVTILANHQFKLQVDKVCKTVHRNHNWNFISQLRYGTKETDGSAGHMTQYGQEVETTYLDDNESTIDIISNIKDYKVTSRFKRVNIRIQVSNKREETEEFLRFSDMIDTKRKAGLLIVRDRDPATRPSFVVEYPKTDIDGTYFIIRSYTELVI